jgi:hypothetical protein
VHYGRTQADAVAAARARLDGMHAPEPAAAA